MNLKCRLILEDYRKQRDDFIKLGDTVHSMLSDIVKDLRLTVLAVEHRVKEERALPESLKEREMAITHLKILPIFSVVVLFVFFLMRLIKSDKKLKKILSSTVKIHRIKELL